MSIFVYTFGPLYGDHSMCALCPARIDHRVDAPLSQRTFRVIWRTTGQYELSGVGLRSVQDRFVGFRVPRDRHKRWDTMEDDYVTLSLPWKWRDDLVLFHELCWERLEDHFNPGEIRLGTLSWILSYFPRHGTDSHRYVSGGFSVLPTEPPFYQPSLEQLLQRGVRIPDRTPEVATQFAHRRNSTDPFTALPLEIKDIIAEQLSTRDILRLRTVSRAMEGIFFSSRFWRARFEINGERGFLYRIVRESSRGTGDGLDWQHLYHSTSTLPWNEKVNAGQTRLLDVQGRALQHYHNTRWAGTKVETVDIPPKLAKVGVSILADDNQGIFITGLEFYSEDGFSESVGYKTPGARTRTETEMASRVQHRYLSGYSSMSGKRDLHPLQDFYRSPGFHVLMDATSLEGFEITKTPNGIHDLCLLRQGQSLNSSLSNDAPGDCQRLHMTELISVVATSDIYVC
ncbi:hypothetical protein ABOM_007918 [Aspergillus bombycis]|uniref:F-box domain-containing protein n=1 Tax=Aspergillus bombycis TaxID=109264 RepID=A0A1F7ZS94_9EURO|nr:hypothetical protein ABOM_007918 [Aspergillus bombycis]OGM42314.1 hypothetical protein ABOM_007918 [Aspergillus bombycis]